MSTQSVIYTKHLTERGETDVLKEKIFVYLIIVPPFTRRIDKNGVLVMSSKKSRRNAVSNLRGHWFCGDLAQHFW